MPIGLPAAILGGAVLGGVTSYLGSKKQANAATNAANLQQSTFNTLNAQQQPYIQGGYGALGKLNTLLGLNPDPNYRAPSSYQAPSYRPSFGGYPSFNQPSNNQPSNPTGTPPRIPYDPGPPKPGLYPGLPGGTFGATMTPDIYRMLQGRM